MLALNLNPDRYAGKTIMIIGAGYIQEPAVRIAKKLGLRVLAVDQDPQAPGLRWADLPLLISTSELAACTEAGRQQQINGVMSMGSEQGARTAAAVAHNLGLPGIPVEVAESFTNKVSIRRIMQEQQIPSPRFFICRTKLEAHKALLQLGLPLIVKPPDCHSSFGVTKVEKPEDFEWALERAAAFSHGETWVIEEYIQAVAHGGGVESFVVDGEIHIVTIITGKPTAPPYCTYHQVNLPVDLPEPLARSVTDFIAKVIRATGITNGPVHIQYRYTADGPKLIELSPRLGGICLNSRLIPLALGVNLIQAAIDVCLGLTPDLTPRFRRGACQHFITLPPGIVEKTPALDHDLFSVPGLFEIRLLIKPGDLIPEYHSFALAPGYCITHGDTPEEAVRNAEEVCRQIAAGIVMKGQ
ncbi:MAG: ATP-grasp domain-containing protein [Peptococcia bacterium]|jgi:biotin carboxylase